MTGQPPVPAGYRGGRTALLVAFAVVGLLGTVLVIVSRLPADYGDWLSGVIDAARGVMF